MGSFHPISTDIQADTAMTYFGIRKLHHLCSESGELDAAVHFYYRLIENNDSFFPSGFL